MNTETTKGAAKIPVALHDLISLRAALEGIEIGELYDVETESNRRKWADSASMWLRPGDAVARVEYVPIKNAIRIVNHYIQKSKEAQDEPQ
jgi:hypothetical protein